MTDKEIIIDGVVVAGCEHHLSTGYCQLQMIFQGMLLKLPFGKHLECNLCDKDCYYKQLKRLEFENKLIKADYEASEIEIEDLKNKLNLLITANNHLLELDKYRQKELETKAEATKSNIHNLALLSKAKQTLQEIKAIAEDAYENDSEYQATGVYNEIIQKITKAEEE